MTGCSTPFGVIVAVTHAVGLAFVAAPRLVVLGLVNYGVVTGSDFLTWREACQLTAGGRKKFFEAYEHRKATFVTHPTYGYKVSYGRTPEVQARMLAAYVRGDVPKYTGFTVR